MQNHFRVTTVYREPPQNALPFAVALMRSIMATALTVWKLDRLGRSLRDLITMLDDLKQRGVKFRFIT
jgi:hypothetical protein